MNKNQKHLQKIIDEEIEIFLNDLKSDIKERFVYVFRDDIKYKKDSIITAETHQYTEKKLIVFYTSAISEIIYGNLKNWMREIIKHEVAHLFTQSEQEVAKREKKFNIFK